MRENIVADWAFGITGAIENSVRRVFPQELRRWPLLVAFDGEAYELPEQHMVIVLRDKLSGIPAMPGVPEPYPYDDHPTLPPKPNDVELWQFYLRDKFDLREEDAALVIPIRDSEQSNARADFELFSTEEKMFWRLQIGYVVATQAAHLQIMGGPGPQQPSTVTYEASGPNARVYINSSDHSVNEVSLQVSEVFDQLRGVLADVED